MRIGVLGAGQLGRMLALAGYPLAKTFVFYDMSGSPSAGLGEVIIDREGQYLDDFLSRVDRVTYEFEHLPVNVAEKIAAHKPVHPCPRALQVCQNREAEKTLFGGLGIPTPEWKIADSAASLKATAEELGCPVVAKSNTEGYDGKGQAVLKSPEDAEAAWTEAVAGTRRRGDGPDARFFHDELAESEKDRREHAFVRDFISEALAPLTSVICVEPPVQIEAARVRHLKTPVRATLREGVTPLEVMTALHPTPAVGGTPTPAALGAIRQLEGFDRGLYAGPVGWVSRDAAEFAVGIRSGLLCGADLALYAGAGIVPGSVPEAEWHETEAKLGGFADALGLEG